MDPKSNFIITSEPHSEAEPGKALPHSAIQNEPHDSDSRFEDLKNESMAVSTDDTEKEIEETERHPNVVDWDGPDDPEKALNWSIWKKRFTVILVGCLTLFTPFASSMLAPGITLVMTEFHNTSETIGSLTVSIYLLGYAFGPLVIAPLSEFYGRLPVYHTSTVLFIVFNVACAQSTNFPMLIVFRLMTGLSGSAPLTLGPGTIADMYRQEDRGKIMAVWTLPILFGPAIGPIAGGYLSEFMGWRWDFYLLIILIGVVFLISLVFQKETYGPTILEKRTQRLRKVNGNPNLVSALRTTKSQREIFLASILRPTKMLFMIPIILGLSIFTAIVYGTLYLLFTTMTNVFEEVYGFPADNVSLTYLGLGIGQILGATAFGMVSDGILRRMAKSGDMKPEYRLPPLIMGVMLLTIGLLWYGWTAHFRVMWMVPIIGMVVVGAGVTMSFLPVNTYLVDAYTAYAASAVAANAVLRSIGGALLPLCGKSMYAALGLGWGNTLLAFITLMCLPMVLGFIKYGERLRTHPRFKFVE